MSNFSKGRKQKLHFSHPTHFACVHSNKDTLGRKRVYFGSSLNYIHLFMFPFAQTQSQPSQQIVQLFDDPSIQCKIGSLKNSFLELLLVLYMDEFYSRHSQQQLSK